MPTGVGDPADPADLTWDQYQLRRELGRKLGDKGWLWPTAPAEYGGGGLDVDSAVVIEEEIDSFGLTLPPYYDSGGRLGGNSILVWGTEAQKQSFLPPIFTGRVRTWQLLSEPEAGSDLANVKTQAIRDGDEYVLNGQKIFVGSDHGCDYMWTITVTDPEAKRHENLGWFMVPSHLPGITIQPMDLLISGGESGAGSGVKQTVYFDSVRVPAFNLVGGENEGWKVATTHLELEHGTGGRIGRNWLVDRLFEHCRTTERRGKPMTNDPDVRDRLIDVYVEAEIVRLLNMRNYWMRPQRRSHNLRGAAGLLRPQDVRPPHVPGHARHPRARRADPRQGARRRRRPHGGPLPRRYRSHTPQAAPPTYRRSLWPAASASAARFASAPGRWDR